MSARSSAPYLDSCRARSGSIGRNRARIPHTIPLARRGQLTHLRECIEDALEYLGALRGPVVPEHRSLANALDWVHAELDAADVTWSRLVEEPGA